MGFKYATIYNLQITSHPAISLKNFRIVHHSNCRSFFVSNIFPIVLSSSFWILRSYPLTFLSWPIWKKRTPQIFSANLKFVRQSFLPYTKYSPQWKECPYHRDYNLRYSLMSKMHIKLSGISMLFFLNNELLHKKMHIIKLFTKIYDFRNVMVR